MKSAQEWSAWKLEECCDILDSRRIPVNSEDREKRMGDIPYYGANGLQGYIDDYIFDEPLILIAEDGGQFDEFATKPIAYRIEGKSWVNNHAHVLRGKAGFSQDAIFYALEHKDIQPFIVGGTRAKLNQGALRSITINLPEKESEQSKIAEVLSKVDQAIEQTESLIAKQQRIKSGLMQDLLTRGIDEHGNLRSEETHEFKDSPLGRIPVEWDFVPIASVLRKSPKNGYSPVESNSWNGTYMLGLGCLTTSGFQPVQLKYAPQFSSVFKKAILKQGDFLISRSNTRDLVGLVGIYKDVGVPCIYPDLMIRLCFSNDVVTEFMEQVFMSALMRRQITNAATGTSGSMVKICSSLVKNFYFFKPGFEEQQRIIKILEEQDSSRITIEKTKNKLYLLKTALMQDLLTGKKRVTPLMEATEVCA